MSGISEERFIVCRPTERERTLRLLTDQNDINRYQDCRHLQYDPVNGINLPI